MRRYEIPYNFADDYIEEMSHIVPHMRNQIDFIYLDSWKEDGINTRKAMREVEWYPKTYQDYLTKIHSLQSAFGIPLCILLQKNANMDLIEKYYQLGISNFIINDDKLAIKIKVKHPDIKLTLSITRVLTFEDIMNETNDYSMYDDIVLFFWFNRHLDHIKMLPEKYKYTIIINNNCSIYCNKYRQHWFGSNIELKDTCYNVNKNRSIRKATFIYINDLCYFEPYIYRFKIVDRDAPTKVIQTCLLKLKSSTHIKTSFSENFYNIESELSQKDKMIIERIMATYESN